MQAMYKIYHEEFVFAFLVASNDSTAVVGWLSHCQLLSRYRVALFLLDQNRRNIISNSKALTQETHTVVFQSVFSISVCFQTLMVTVSRSFIPPSCKGDPQTQQFCCVFRLCSFRVWSCYANV